MPPSLPALRAGSDIDIVHAVVLFLLVVIALVLVDGFTAVVLLVFGFTAVVLLGLTIVVGFTAYCGTSDCDFLPES